MNTPRDNEAELVPPDPQRVAARALVLAAVTCRGALEGDAGDPNAEAFRKDVVSWIRETGPAGEIEERELGLLDTPLGALPSRQVIDASWRAEGMAVLGWALDKLELPAYDTSVDSPSAAESLGFLAPDATDRIAAARLRPHADLERLAHLYVSIHWRVRQFSMDRQPMDFRTFATECWFRPLETTGIAFVDDDLGIRGSPLGVVDEEQWRYCLSIARERQQAANWLLGYDPVYSEVGCDT